MMDKTFRARVLKAMEAEYGEAETPEQQEILLATLAAATLASSLALDDFRLAIVDAVTDDEARLKRLMMGE